MVATTTTTTSTRIKSGRTKANLFWTLSLSLSNRNECVSLCRRKSFLGARRVRRWRTIVEIKGVNLYLKRSAPFICSTVSESARAQATPPTRPIGLVFFFSLSLFPILTLPEEIKMQSPPTDGVAIHIWLDGTNKVIYIKRNTYIYLGAPVRKRKEVARSPAGGSSFIDAILQSYFIIDKESPRGKESIGNAWNVKYLMAYALLFLLDAIYFYIHVYYTQRWRSSCYAFPPSTSCCSRTKTKWKMNTARVCLSSSSSLCLYRERAQREDYTFLRSDTPAESINKNPRQQQQPKRSFALSAKRKNVKEASSRGGASGGLWDNVALVVWPKRRGKKKGKRIWGAAEKSRRRKRRRRRRWIDLLSLSVREAAAAARVLSLGKPPATTRQ